MSGLLEFGDISHLFRGSEVEPFEFVRGFVKEYGKLPKPETILEHTGEELVAGAEPSAYYHDKLVLRHTELVVKTTIKKANEFLAADNKDPEAAMKVMADAVIQAMSKKHSKQIVDFREAFDLLWPEYLAKKLKNGKGGLRFGWPYLDGMAGGVVKGDVVSFVGRPASGKTFQMLYAALHGWRQAGPNVEPDNDQSRMFVSMEMNILPIEQRLAAMQTHMNLTHVKNSGLGTPGVKKFKDGLMEIKGYGAPFYIIDGNLTATVEDVYMMARQLKPAAIFIDGGYLLQHPHERDQYKRVAVNANLIKQHLAALAPTVVSWQFNRDAAKKSKKKGETVGLEDIGSTDVIGQVSSLVLGIFEEENIETVKTRKIQVLKGRSGETGEFRTRWDFAHMNFDEIAEVEVEDLQF